MSPPLSLRCPYFGCGATKADNNNIPLHRFPQDHQLPQWIENSGNSRLETLAPSTLRKYGLCNKHFDAKDFLNSDAIKLNHRAIPKPVSIVFRSAYQPIVPEDSALQACTTVQQSNNACNEYLPHVSLQKEDILPQALEVLPSAMEIESPEVTDRRPTAQRREANENVKNAMRIDEPPPPHRFQEHFTPSLQLPRANACCELQQAKIEQVYDEIAKLHRANHLLRSENDKFQSKIEKFQNKIANLQYAVRQIPKQIEKAKNEITLDEFLASREVPLKPAAKTMIKLQLHKPNTPYDDDEKALSKEFFYLSHGAYWRLREGGCNFPSTSTVRRWNSKYDIHPGFCDVVFEQLKETMDKLPPNQRMCSMSWDEMAIKADEEYSVKYDLIEGLEDLGPLERKPEHAKYVFSINLTSLDAENRWRQPVAYFLAGAGGLNAEEIHHLVCICLRKLREVGVDVRLLVCDQGPNNQRTFDREFKVTAQNPWFEFEGKRYYCCFDFPHLIKRVITQLRSHGGIWESQSAKKKSTNPETHTKADASKDENRRPTIIASWNDFKFAKQCDSMSSTSHLLDHITPAHIEPDRFQTMNVKRAFQIVGNRYAQAIRLAGASAKAEAERAGLSTDLENAVWKTCEVSAQFAEKMNSFVDACNSPGLISANPNNRPLSPNNPQIEVLIRDMIDWTALWRTLTNCRGKKGLTGEKTWTTPPRFRGLQLTGNAFLGVYESVRQDFPKFEFATARGNQDGTEHWFALLRARNGNCRNPTARMVRLSIRHSLSMGFVNVGHGANVQCEDNAYLTAAPSTSVSKAFNELPPLSNDALEMNETEDFTHNKEMSDVIESLVQIEGWDDFNETDEEELMQFLNMLETDERTQAVKNAAEKQTQFSLYEGNAVTYFVGYVAFKVLGKLKCECCRQAMVKTPMDARNTNEIYIEYREYENPDIEAPTVTKLQRPTDAFRDIFGIQLQTFERVCDSYWHCRSVLRSIVADIERDTNIYDPTWFQSSHSCYKHRIKIAEFTVKVKIFSRTRANNRILSGNKLVLHSQNTKLKNITHQ